MRWMRRYMRTAIDALKAQQQTELDQFKLSMQTEKLRQAALEQTACVPHCPCAA